MQRVIGALTAGLLLSAAAIAYAGLGPYYAVEPLQASLISNGSLEEFSFEVGRTAGYNVVLLAPRDRSAANLGVGVATWEVKDGNTILASGSQDIRSYHPFPEGAWWVFVIGDVWLVRGTAYVLGVSIDGRPVWREGEAQARVELHPSYLEYLAYYSLWGSAGLLILGPMLVGTLGVVVYRWMKRSTPDC